MNSPAQPLAERVAALLDPLGGRTAIAARYIPLPARPAPALPATPHDHAHDHERANQLNDAPDAAQSVIAVRADEVFPAASLAKIPIAIEVLRRADLGQFTMDERLDTAQEPRVGGGGVLDYLDPTTTLTLADICTLMIAVSDNTAANFLLDLVGMGEINESMNRLNLKHTKLERRFMDFAARAAHRDNRTSANDTLTLLTLIRGGALPGGRRLLAMLGAQQLFAELRDDWLPEHAQLAHKGGSLPETFHDAGILTGPGGSCVYCVLTTGQRDVPAARTVICRCVRLLWDTWLAD